MLVGFNLRPGPCAGIGTVDMVFELEELRGYAPLPVESLPFGVAMGDLVDGEGASYDYGET